MIIKKPSIFSILKESFQFTGGNFKILLKISAAPLTFLLVEELFNIYEKITLSMHWFSFLMIAISALIQSFWVPKWIRICHNAKAKVDYLGVDRANAEFFGFKLLIGTFFLLWGIIFSPVLQVLNFTTMLTGEHFFVKYTLIAIMILLGMGLAVILYARYSFKFVAISLSKKMSLNSAWRHTAPFALQLYTFQVLNDLKMGTYLSYFSPYFSEHGKMLLQVSIILAGWFLTAIYFCIVTKLYKHSDHK